MSETKQQVADEMFDYIQKAEESEEFVYGPRNDGRTPKRVADDYRRRYAVAIEESEDVQHG